MATNRNEHMRYRYGICLNDSCEKCKNKEVQQIPSRKDLVCESCGKPMRECPPPKSFGQKYGKLIGIIAAIVVVIGVVIAFLVIPTGDKEPEEAIVATDTIIIEDPVVIEQPQIDSAAIQAMNDSLALKALEDSIKLAKADSILNAQQLTETAEEETKNEQTQPAKQPQPTTTQTTTHKLSYGSWTGGWKNGQPHGTGTLTYSTARQIDSRDPKQRVAHPGEYIVGEWDNGHLVQGRWFKKDGTKEAVIIGKVG